MYVMMTFLEANGLTVTATDDDVVEAGLSVAAGKMKYEGLLDWVRRHLA